MGPRDGGTSEGSAVGGAVLVWIKHFGDSPLARKPQGGQTGSIRCKCWEAVLM